MAALDLIGEYDARGRAIHETVYLGDLPVAVLDGTNCFGEGRTSTNIHYVSTDNLGAPHIITDERGRKVWQWSHAPFGDTKPTEAAGFTYDLRFPGQIADAESGLNYNMMRNYNSALGRYAESDPIGLPAGVNTYGYVEQDPIARLDISGLCPGDRATCISRYLRDTYGEYAATNIIPRFSLYSYVP